MGSKKHKEKDKEHRRKHKHRDRSKSKEKHRTKRTKAEKEERKARKKAAKAQTSFGSTNETDDLVTEIDYGHGYQVKKSERDERDGKYEHRERDHSHATEAPVASHTKVEPLTEALPARESQGSSSSLSVSETNKLRAKLGLKPLEVDIPGVTGENGKGKKEDVHAPAINMSHVKRTQKIKERTEASRGKRVYEDKLSKIKGLGDSDSGDDTFAWVKKSRIKQREKELAAKREKILDEMDAEFGLSDLVEKEFNKDKKPSYTERDLTGLIVQHTLDRFQEGSSVIMTLDDKRILDDDGDVLINVNIADQEKVDKNLENKKRGPSYNPYDNAETDDFGMAKPMTMLSKYDEEIDGEKKERFELGSRGGYSGSHEKALSKIKDEFITQRQSLSLMAPQLASEYYTIEEMNAKFKKKKKTTRKLRDKAAVRADDLLSEADGTGDHHGSRSRGPGLNTEVDMDKAPDISEPKDEVVTEEASQAAYMHYGSGGGAAWPGQEVKMRLESMRDMKTELDSDSDSGPMEDLTGVIVDPDDAESELQAALDKTRRLKQMQNREKPDRQVYNRVAHTQRQVKKEPVIVDKKNSIELNSISEFCRSLGEIPTYGLSGNREDDEELMEFDNEQEALADEDPTTGWAEVDIDDKPVDILEDDENILNDEPIVNKGLGTALSLAVQKGYLEQEVTRMVSAQQSSKLLVENYSIEDKRYEDLDDKMRKRDRYVGALSDFKDKSGYKPDIKLEYVDDKGNMLSNKEAFRYLSHRFHGKGSGKKKTEKRGKKVDDDLLMKQMSSIDTPLGTLNLLKAKQKQEKSPYVILTGVSSNKAFMANTITK